MKKQYDTIYSIGQDCACATYMKQARIRECSGPFDWLTSANFEKRINIILNDFDDFLNKEDLKVMPKPTQFPADKNNTYYENIRTGLYFWHDFPADKNLETAYPLVKEKYDRRINSFIENIKTKENILLIYFTHFSINNDELIKELCEKVCKKFDKNIDFLIVEYDETKKDDEIDSYNISENILIYKLNTRMSDKNGAPTTLGKAHLCQPIFNQFEIKKTIFVKIMRNFNFVLSKIICPFILNKHLRSKLKEQLRK